jgi:hypothetical protein
MGVRIAAIALACRASPYSLHRGAAYALCFGCQNYSSKLNSDIAQARNNLQENGIEVASLLDTPSENLNWLYVDRPLQESLDTVK